MNILVIGDIFGKPGRQAIAELLPGIIKREKVDFVTANIENAAGGRGVTPKTAKELFKTPINIYTAGNHIWEFDSIHEMLDSHPILRPMNVKENLPGKGMAIMECHGKKIAVISLQGEIFMDDKGAKATNPFHAMDALLPQIVADIILVDFHAEATSEKRALGWYLDGRISALLGTHTHIQTADEEILSKGTAYITDLGMTGPHHSVIGLKKEVAIHRFLAGEKKGFKVAVQDVRLEGVLLELNDNTNGVKSIRRIRERLEN